MRSVKTIHVISAHAEGEVGDVIVGGVTPPPGATLWEQRRALARLRELGHEKVDEASLFRMIGQMRDIVATARKATRKTRREADRRRHLTAKPPPAALVPPSVDTTGPAGKLPPASPFDEIEEW